MRYFLLSSLCGLVCTGLPQQSFYEDFPGPGRGSWGLITECASDFVWTVSDSMLHVTQMKYPNCKETVWLAGIPNLFDTTQGFEMSVRVGWEDKPGRFTFKAALGSANPPTARMDAGPGGVTSIVYNRDGIVSQGSVSAPRSGFFTLKIQRYGSVVKTFFDDTLVAEGITDIFRDNTQVWIGFYAPNDQVQMGYHVDWAEGHPVPEPASRSALGIGAIAVMLTRRRRRRR